MKTLALETSLQPGSIAVFERNVLLYETSLQAGKHTTQTLLVSVQQALDQVGFSPRNIELVAVTTGPGSFTGLRISVTTAKTFAYATGAAAIGLNTLCVIAHQGADSDGRLRAVMDAHRGELFAAEFQVTGGKVALIEPTRIVGRDRWLRECCDGDTATGPGLGLILQELPHGVRPVVHDLWTPRAATVGTLAWLAHQHGEHDDPWSLTPNYFRQSAAEEKSRTRGTNGR